MIIVKYACIARDNRDKKIAVVGTGNEPLTGVRGRNVAPTFHRFLLSFLALHPSATSVETVRWSADSDIELLPPVLLAARADQPGQLAYSFPVEEVGA